MRLLWKLPLHFTLHITHNCMANESSGKREEERDGGLVWVSGWNRKKEKHLEGEKMKNRKRKERSEQVKGKEEKEWIIKEFMRGCNSRRGKKRKREDRVGITHQSTWIVKLIAGIVNGWRWGRGGEKGERQTSGDTTRHLNSALLHCRNLV